MLVTVKSGPALYPTRQRKPFQLAHPMTERRLVCFACNPSGRRSASRKARRPPDRGRDARRPARCAAATRPPGPPVLACRGSETLRRPPWDNQTPRAVATPADTSGLDDRPSGIRQRRSRPGYQYRLPRAPSIVVGLLRSHTVGTLLRPLLRFEAENQRSPVDMLPTTRMNPLSHVCRRESQNVPVRD